VGAARIDKIILKAVSGQLFYILDVCLLILIIEYVMEYNFKVWFVTIVMSPIIICLILGDSDSNVFSLLELYPLMLFFGAAFSLPTILIQILAMVMMKKAGLKSLSMKLIFSMVALAGVVTSFYIVKVSFIKYLGPCAYSAVMIGSIWFFNLSEEDKDI
jgi:hypothetical protein